MSSSSSSGTRLLARAMRRNGNPSQGNAMENSHDETDGNNGNHLPRELRLRFANGTQFVHAVLNGPSEGCLKYFRMDKQVFLKLRDILQSNGLLRHTNRIRIEEQLAIFLFTVGHNIRTRAVQELFHYSGETISRHFNNVLNAIMKISLGFFLPSESETPQAILQDQRFYPYFKDCVGTVDGIHMPVTVGVDEQVPYRDQRGVLSQYVLAACSFDLKFQYVLAGWEGSAPDMLVLSTAITRSNNLKVPPGKYYLIDNKFANMPGFIAPYSGDAIGHPPQGARELFNRMHSQLRSAGDRIFAALKGRFPILLEASPYPLQTQVKLVVASCALHNFIRMEKPDDLIFQFYEHHPVLQMAQAPAFGQASIQDEDIPFEQEELKLSSQLRDTIATELWNQHVHMQANKTEFL